MTRKLIIHDGRAERELVLVASITVGRDPSCHISDLDPLLSRRHAEFVTTASGCTVRDLGSRNGMLVNGVKVREQLLKEGDLIQLGHLQLRYAEVATLDTPEARAMSHATTAHESATMASPAAQLADLEDTKPHPPHAHAHAGHDDADVTRLPDADAAVTRLPVRAANEEPTMAPKASAPEKTTSPVDDTDPTMAPIGHGKPAAAVAASAPGSFSDPDATFVAGRGMQAMAPIASDPDATFVAGFPRPGAPPADVDATMASMKQALPAGDLDRTIAPGSIDLDATFVAGMSLAHNAKAVPPTAPAEARVTVGADLRITTATPACRALFGVAPDALVGQALGDVLAQRLKAAADAGPAELTFVVERSPSDRSLIVTLKAAQAVETVS